MICMFFEVVGRSILYAVRFNDARGFGCGNFRYDSRVSANNFKHFVKVYSERKSDAMDWSDLALNLLRATRVSNTVLQLKIIKHGELNEIIQKPGCKIKKFLLNFYQIK